jgi:hypothetical protein
MTSVSWLNGRRPLDDGADWFTERRISRLEGRAGRRKAYRRRTRAVPAGSMESFSQSGRRCGRWSEVGFGNRVVRANSQNSDGETMTKSGNVLITNQT